MKSKEALTKLSNMASPYHWRSEEQIELIGIVKKDLECLEKLKKEYDYLKKDYYNKDLECIDLYTENQELLIALKNKIKEIGNLKKLIYNNPYKRAIEILKESLDLEFVDVNKETANDLELFGWVLENDK